jgi:capsular polysaccharide transport system permease protein
MNRLIRTFNIKSPASELIPRLLRRLAALRNDEIITVRSGRRPGVLGWSFIIAVLAPTFIAALYLALIASRQYVAEARFAIRTGVEINSGGANSALGAIASSFGSANSTMQDAYIVSDYIRSRTIIEDIGGKDIVHKIYSRADVDWFSRLPSSRTIEKIWKYWKGKIEVTIDTPTGIITLETSAFTQEDAKTLADLILLRSEALVNQISERSRTDALRRAENEVQLAQERLRIARAELLVYRNRTNVLDPEQAAKSIGDIIAKLYLEKVKIETDMASVSGSVSANSPTAQIARARIANLEKEIAALQSKLTSEQKNTALSDQISGYEETQLKVQFAEKLYAITQASYEKAREEQEKQQLYLVTIVRPSLPEEATYPRRVVDIAIVFAVLLVLWSMISLVVALIRDHME